MERHFTYTINLFPGDTGMVLEKFVFGIVLGLIILFLGSLAAKKIITEVGIKENLIPKKFSIFSVIDIFSEKFIKFHDSFLGKENRKYYSLSASIFIFILLANLLGLIPGMPAITTTVIVTVSMALVVFVVFNYLGIKEHGLLNYLKHFVGGKEVIGQIKIFPLKGIALALFMLIISILLGAVEILSAFLRILTLQLRLYWNITADHMVLYIFNNEIISGFLGWVFYGLGTFVSFMQAFIFTVLTMVYILLATAHEEEEH